MQAVQTDTGLIIPANIATEHQRVLRCMVPGCGAEYPEHQTLRFERHVRQCSERHSDVIDEMVAEARSDYFRAPADTELYEHVRKGGT